jgi:hypothetical protein
VPDLPFQPSDPAVAARVATAFDPEAKVLRAIDALAPLDGRRLALLGAAPAFAAALTERGASVTVVEPAPTASHASVHVATGQLPATADIVLAPWTGFDGTSDVAELEAADRILVSGGRLLVLQDYGRDDLTPVRGPERVAHLLARSRRDGWLIQHGFKVHVIHAWWRFADLAQAGDLLRAAFGGSADAVIEALRKPVVAHNVVIYHRTAGEN